MEWTTEHVDRFKSLFYQTDPVLSFTQIAKEMGVSRSASIGKAHRLGLQRARLTRWDKPPRPAPKRTLGNHIAGKVKRHHKPDGIRDDLRPEKVAKPVHMFDLKEHHCRWPLGEPSKMMFCGSDKERGQSYCARHCQLAYRQAHTVSGRDRQQSRFQALRNILPTTVAADGPINPLSLDDAA